LGIEKRITSLREKHAVADAQLQLLQILPVRNQEKIQELKKRKLWFKDEIERLKNPARLTAPKKRKKSNQSQPVLGAKKNESHDATQSSVSDESGSPIDLAA
jgi:hypothetical protein